MCAFVFYALLGQHIQRHTPTMKQGLPFSEFRIQLQASKDIKGCTSPGASHSLSFSFPLSTFLLLFHNPHRISQHIKP